MSGWKRMRRALSATLRRWAVEIGARNGWLASMYYAFLSGEFRREHHAVLQGRRVHEADKHAVARSSYTLRRNIHRLEKGLVMQPRKPTFGEHYIQEAVDCYAAACCSDQHDTAERRWARDVLEQYFAAVTATPVIAAAHAAFRAVDSGLDGPSTAIPYAHESLPASEVSFDALRTLFTRRRSVRWYQDRPVPGELITRAIDAALLAPSACNRQPFRYVVAHGERAQALADCAVGTKGFAHNLPCVIAAIGDLSAYAHERDRHLIYIDASLANMQLMLALETLGLQSCPLNWADVRENEERIARLCDLAVHERTIMLIAVGYATPDGGVPYSQKKSATDLVSDLDPPDR